MAAAWFPRSHSSWSKQRMRDNLPQRLAIALKDWHHRLLFTVFLAAQPIYRKLFRSDVAYLYCDHPVLTPFIIRMTTKLGINVHLLKPGEDFSGYRKILIPNGKWPEVAAAADDIPPEKRVYCEVGFFPQNRNVYFDDRGVHGHSSVRDITLAPLSAREKTALESFRQFYTGRNYTKLRWDTVELQDIGSVSTDDEYREPFVFVPLQLESDTAFELCPFPSNQAMIDAIEYVLPYKRIIFKVHPWDDQARYRVHERNLLLPYTNRDLRQLLLRAESVVNCNSTVMLEAMLYGKKCASLGIGFATNHHISLECHEDINLLTELDQWVPDDDRVDSFLFHLLRKQVNINFWKSPEQVEKLNYWMKQYGVL